MTNKLGDLQRDLAAHRQQNRSMSDKSAASPTTYSQLANVDQELGGRFAKESRVSGAEPNVRYPRLPSSSPWASDPVPPEEPLGFEIDAMEPVGNPGEIEASLAEAAALMSGSGVVETSLVNPTVSTNPTIRRRKL
jgi:hypothetical protein